jgi:hypothetical protein
MPAGTPSAGQLNDFIGYTPAATSLSASKRRKIDCGLNAMSESIQKRWVNDPSDKNLSTILLRPRVIRLSLCICRMQGRPTCVLSRARLNMLAT